MLHSGYNYYAGKIPVPSPGHGHNGVYAKQNTSDIVRYLEANGRDSDMWACGSVSITGLIQYYSSAPRELYYFYVYHENPYWKRRLSNYRTAHRINDHWATVVMMDTPEDGRAVLESLPDRIWYLQSTWKRNGELEENCRAGAQLLQTRYRLAQSEWIHGVLVSLYTRTPSR